MSSEASVWRERDIESREDAASRSGKEGERPAGRCEWRLDVSASCRRRRVRPSSASAFLLQAHLRRQGRALNSGTDRLPPGSLHGAAALGQIARVGSLALPARRRKRLHPARFETGRSGGHRMGRGTGGHEQQADRGKNDSAGHGTPPRMRL